MSRMIGRGTDEFDFDDGLVIPADPIVPRITITKGGRQLDIVYTGVFRCEIDKQRRRVIFTMRRGVDPMPDGSVKALLDWAMRRVSGYRRRGYDFDLSELPSWILDEKGDLA